MDEQEKQRIQSALDQHGYDITLQLSPVIDGLVLKLKKDISEVEYNNITSENNSMKKVQLLLESIRTRPHIFGVFCNALKELKHNDLATTLLCMFHTYVFVINYCICKRIAVCTYVTIVCM